MKHVLVVKMMDSCDVLNKVTFFMYVLTKPDSSNTLFTIVHKQLKQLVRFSYIFADHKADYFL